MMVRNSVSNSSLKRDSPPNLASPAVLFSAVAVSCVGAPRRQSLGRGYRAVARGTLIRSEPRGLYTLRSVGNVAEVHDVAPGDTCPSVPSSSPSLFLGFLFRLLLGSRFLLWSLFLAASLWFGLACFWASAPQRTPHVVDLLDCVDGLREALCSGGGQKRVYLGHAGLDVALQGDQRADLHLEYGSYLLDSGTRHVDRDPVRPAFPHHHRDVYANQLQHFGGVCRDFCDLRAKISEQTLRFGPAGELPLVRIERVGQPLDVALETQQVDVDDRMPSHVLVHEDVGFEGGLVSKVERAIPLFRGLEPGHRVGTDQCDDRISLREPRRHICKFGRSRTDLFPIGLVLQNRAERLFLRFLRLRFGLFLFFGGPCLPSDCRTPCARLLLRHVGQFVGQQAPALRRPRRVPPGGEYHVAADRVSQRVHCSGRLVCLRVGVDAHPAEVVSPTPRGSVRHTGVWRAHDLSGYPVGLLLVAVARFAELHLG